MLCPITAQLSGHPQDIEFERVYTLHGEESVKVGDTLSARCTGPKGFFSNA
jgi:hypothetical protein